MVRYPGRGHREILCRHLQELAHRQRQPLSRWGKEVHGKDAGSVMVVEFDIDGQTFTALNGGPQFTVDEAVSFQVMCETQAEIDYYWIKLTADGGSEVQCGWLKD
jgi:predicted 3-demethylubiquinone-9 3-methyltransferase (glyoxalase superfamily)